eukprot:TRINITY_DN4261_c0_g3_i2.p1 TRINITY_DN4261_c0_g3~~TRINITY_DN4261_c0_g3_i2.p1  ORF type:complete len:337 (-),score=106.61 TRINITY_DN4261_c0_g3_i2:594-1604(-)
MSDEFSDDDMGGHQDRFPEGSRDDNFEYGDEDDGKDHKADLVANQPFDEVVHLSDNDDEIATPEQSKASVGHGQKIHQGHDEEDEGEEDDDGEEEPDHHEEERQVVEKRPEVKMQAAPKAAPMSNQPQNTKPNPAYESHGETEGSDEEEEEEEEEPDSPSKTGYNPADYADLPVSQEIKEIFQYITRYKPQTIEVDTKMKPFIPDYIPAVGDIDAFIKVGRPDGKPDLLGLTMLDEPSSKQSDPTVFDLQLRAISKQAGTQPMAVRNIENAEKNPKAITSWVNSINELHRSKPQATVHYSRKMPDLEELMQVWPAEFEETLKQVGFFSSNIMSFMI